MARVALIVPTYNAAAYLPSLWQSLVAASVQTYCEEVIFVDDGSTDDTAAVLDELAARFSFVRVVRLGQNSGRFVARLRGADLAHSDHLLFVDSRVTVQKSLFSALAGLPPSTRAAMGVVDIDTEKNHFCLYWDRTHRLLFWRHYRDTQTPLMLTTDNFDRYLKGTTLLYVERSLFLAACQEFAEPPLSDDNALLSVLVQRSSILIDPALRIDWEPRGTTKEFLARLWERGPSFVEHHVVSQQGRFYAVVAGAGMAFFWWLILLVLAPRPALLVAAAALFVAVASTLLLCRRAGDFFRLAPLHLAVCTTFAGAVLRGLFIHAAKAMRRARRQ